MDMSIRDIVEIGVIVVTLIGSFYKVKYTLDQNSKRLESLEESVGELKKKQIKILI